MFTGIVRDVGMLELVETGADGVRFRIATMLASDIMQGDSVAVDGVCLTAVAVEDESFEAEAMNQTLGVTTLGEFEDGEWVNLELALEVSDRLDGHIVQGHVDGTAEVISSQDDGFARRLRVELAPQLMRYVAEKGSIALDGVSLTVAALGEGWVEVALVPETLKQTTLGMAEPGSRMNVECDILAKYVERLMSGSG